MGLPASLLVVGDEPASTPRRASLSECAACSSWLNQVERFFALINERTIRRGTFHSTEELEKAIYKWLATWNGEPATFTWRASAEVILDKVRRCKESSKTRD